MNIDYFEITNELNQKVLCQTLYTFENNNINYVIYTDFDTDENDEINVLASRYKIENNQLVLDKIESEEEWNLIDKVWKEHNHE